ncbi:MAG: hypothetical protein IJB49_02050 [Clostridia bacterium]|nr:hypothetical protein [Clostridia bacterium]
MSNLSRHTQTVDSLGGITKYNYESLTKLFSCVENANSVRTVLYIYDNAGNLTTRYTFPYSTLIPEMLFSTYPSYANPIYYGYSGDRLTNYNGTAITYDVIGNPTKWRNASSMSWDGRTLTSQMLSNGTTVS